VARIDGLSLFARCLLTSRDSRLIEPADAFAAWQQSWLAA